MITAKTSPRPRLEGIPSAATARRPAARAGRRFRPTAPERCEQRLVPTYFMPAPAGFDPIANAPIPYVVMSLPSGEDALKTANSDLGNTNFGQGNGEVCITISLTPAGQQYAQAHGGIKVGLDSFVLTDPAHNVGAQTLIRATSDTLTATHTTVTLCVEVDDFACSQVDAFAGNINPALPGTGSVLGVVVHPTVNTTANQFNYVIEATDLSKPYSIDTDCQPPNFAIAGLSAGYWKNHTSAWKGYNTTMALGGVFAGLNAPEYASLADDSMQQALGYNGGPKLVDKAAILIRQAVAAVLNASSTSVGYPYTIGQIKVMVNDALASKDAATITALATKLAAFNL